LILAVTLACFGAAQQRAVTIEDCIRLVHVEQTRDPDDPSVVFSRDGKQFVSLIWQGDLEKNLNHYSLLLFDAEHLDQKPTELLSVDFGYEEENPAATPLSHFTFLTANRLAALATLQREPRQVISIDLETRRITRLTHHQNGVLAFGATPDGHAIVYASNAIDKDDKKASLIRDGFSLVDHPEIGGLRWSQIAAGDWFTRGVEYFLVKGPGGKAQKIYEGKHGPPDFWISPDGRYAAVYPYVATAGAAPEFGLIDMMSGRLERLLKEAGPSAGRVLWSRDSKSLLIFSKAYAKPITLWDIDLSSRRPRSTVIGQGREWEMVGYGGTGDDVIFTRGAYAVEGDSEQTLAILKRRRDGANLKPSKKLESGFDLNARYYSTTNGRLVVGVKDDLSKPPELAAYDLQTKNTYILTNLNPQLQNMKLGEVSRVRWSGTYDKDTSFGYLIKPVAYVPGTKYPLIIQLKDEPYDPEDASFIIDGGGQYSGAAVQVWANAGFVVLFTPSPLSLKGILETPEEDKHILEHIESAVRMLDEQGLIDTSKIAITGWSRAGWYTEYIVTHSSIKFAAASNIDNVEYNLNRYILEADQSFIDHWGGAQPWGPSSERWRETSIDFKYDKGQTPRLIEVHGQSRVVMLAEPYVSLKAVQVPVEFYVYPDGPHNLRSPSHRLHSLSTNTDWFRFWLQGYEDPTPEKRSQYQRWREMRLKWETEKAGESGKEKKQ